MSAAHDGQHTHPRAQMVALRSTHASTLPFNDDGGTPAATPKAPTLAALLNFTPDACDGRVESEETLLVEGASACLCCSVLLLLRKVCDGA